MSEQDSRPASLRRKMNISLDYRIIIFVLISIIIGLILAWQPWRDAPNSTDRTIKVTGQAKISAEPDEFVFYPSYEFKNADKAAALKELTQKNEEVVNGLKKLGINDNKIKTQSGGNNDGPKTTEYRTDSTYRLSLTVTVNNDKEAQKVQDYLVSTAPYGSVSPQASFSEAKRKELENQAREKATLDARSKADQSANKLGLKIGKVKSLEDGTGFGGIQPYSAQNDLGVSVLPSSKLSIQPGENDLTYAVVIEYYVK